MLFRSAYKSYGFPPEYITSPMADISFLVDSHQILFFHYQAVSAVSFKQK